MIIEETPEGKALVDAWEKAQQHFFNLQGEINGRMQRVFLTQSQQELLALYEEAKAEKERANQALVDGLNALLEQASGDNGMPGQETLVESEPGTGDSAAA